MIPFQQPFQLRHHKKFFYFIEPHKGRMYTVTVAFGTATSWVSSGLAIMRVSTEPLHSVIPKGLSGSSLEPILCKLVEQFQTQRQRNALFSFSLFSAKLQGTEVLHSYKNGTRKRKLYSYLNDIFPNEILLIRPM